MIHFSRPYDHLFVAALVAGTSLIAGAAEEPHPATPGEPIIVHSASSNIDDATNTADFTAISVSQGNTRLTAERARATGLGFQDSQWTFAGQVVIDLQPHGTLRAEQAVLQFRDGTLTQITTAGPPAHFEQWRTDSRRPGHGQADQITYDAKQDTVHLNGHARLSQEDDVEITAPVLVVNIRDGGLKAGSQSESRAVRITVKP